MNERQKTKYDAERGLVWRIADILESLSEKDNIKAQEEYLIGVNNKSEVKWAKMHRVQLRDGTFKIRFRANADANMGLIIFTLEQVNGETPLQKGYGPAIPTDESSQP